MKKQLLVSCLLSLVTYAAHAAREGTPSYYQNGYSSANGYTPYVGVGQKQVVGERTYSYQVPRPVTPTVTGTMTPNGIALPAAVEPATTIWADYSRRVADFRFETGVNSILEWDDMIFNEIGVGAKHVFSMGNFDIFAYGEYRYGSMQSGNWSVDYDLKPYNQVQPEYGIFTISVGDESGHTSNIKFGIGAHHVWDIGGWKLSPSVGYEIFKHNLEMSNHIYPNPGVYIPMITSDGQYVFGDADGNYISVPYTDAANVSDEWYQVCASPEDIKVVTGYANGSLVTGDYDPSMGSIWGVLPGECVVIGGDGAITVPGTTHIYNTTWSGIYVGLEVEKQMTLSDKLRFYAQFGLPSYESEGIWPNRTDWQQNPSFIDKGDNGAYMYRLEMEYNMKLSDRIQLTLKADTDYFNVGKIGGELYVAEYTTWALNTDGSYALDENGLPYLVTTAAHTQKVSDSLKSASWMSFGLHVGLKVAF